MATSWLKARTPLPASRLFLGCAFAGTELSDMSDTIKDRVLHGETPRGKCGPRASSSPAQKSPGYWAPGLSCFVATPPWSGFGSVVYAI